MPFAHQFSEKCQVDYSIALCRLDVLASSLLVFINTYLLQSTLEFVLATSYVLFSIETSWYVLHCKLSNMKIEGPHPLMMCNASPPLSQMLHRVEISLTSFNSIKVAAYTYEGHRERWYRERHTGTYQHHITQWQNQHVTVQPNHTDWQTAI